MSSMLCQCLLLATLLSACVAQEFYEGFPNVPESRYKLYASPATWGEAKTTCENDGDGSHLAIINNLQEAVVVTNLLKRIDGAEEVAIFIGINDIDVEGDWRTINGDRVNELHYANWAVRQPDDFHGVEDCGVVDRNGQLNDVECDQPRPFACERPTA